MDNKDGFSPISQAEEKARRAASFYDDDDFPESLKEIEFSIEICPANSSWHFNRALILDSLGRYEEAIREYETVIGLLPNDLEVLNCLGIDYTRMGEYESALNAFESIQELDYDFEPCYCNRIITYSEMRDFNLAEEMFYLAQQIKSNCSLCFFNIGISMFFQKRYKQAIRCLLRAAEIDSKHPNINQYVALAYWNGGDKTTAKKYFLQELHLNPGNIEAIFDFGLLLLELEDIESAKEKFNRIIELKPDFTPALFYLGEIALNAKDYNKAEILFQKALEKDKTMPGVRYRLACCALISGLKAKTRVYLLEELKLCLKDSFVLTSMGSMFLVCGNLSSAVHCQLQAIDCDCNNADAYYYFGLTCAKKRDFEDAVNLLNHALEIQPENIIFLQVLTLVYSAANRLEEAGNLLKELTKYFSTPEFKQFRRRVWLVQKLNKRANKFLLGKITQELLNKISSVVCEVRWYPADYRILPPFLVKKASWRR